jgi:enoyl-CoA hydratase/carnithine racemase
MPEVGIGYFPDAGTTHAFNKLPPGLGMYLGLTGLSLEGHNVRLCGLATHFVPSSALPGLKETLLGPRGTALSDLREVNSLLQGFEVRSRHL